MCKKICVRTFMVLIALGVIINESKSQIILW